MKTKGLLTAIAVVVLSTSVGYAQRVEETLIDGHPVINCDAMPASTVTTVTKGNTEASLKTKLANETVYKRFAVYNVDNSPWSTWSSAFTVCSNISGGQWRLPTQRELMLIWVLKSELESMVEGFTLLGKHCSATESVDISGYSWYVNFNNNGGVSNGNKLNDDYKVRCVREL